MADPTLGPRAPKNEPPTDWGVLLALLENWGITLRLGLLLCILLAAAVVIVALVVIYLGAVGVGALLTLVGGGGYGTKRFLALRRQPQSKGSRSLLS